VIHITSVDNESQINQILNIEKLLSIAFPTVAFLNYYSARNPDQSLTRCLLISSLLIVILLIYALWTFLQSRVSRIAKQVLDVLIPSLVTIVVIMFTGAASSNYKFLFLFVIIASAIECSKNAAMGISVFVAFLVLAINLIFPENNGEHVSFESDLILAFVFFIISWTISYYVEFRQKIINSLRDKSNIDGLTGLKNHRYFYDILEKLIRDTESSDRKTSLSLLFMDIDDFKIYNDLYGHQKGDEALRIVSKLISDAIQEPAIAARYGGEEFAVLLPDVTEEEALEKAQEIRNSVQKYVFSGEEALPRKSLTISIGVSSYPNQSASGAELVKNADEACYRAKFLYKNRVETYYSALNDFKNIKCMTDSDTIASIKTLLAVIDAKDRYTFGHVERVVFYCTLFAQKMNFSEENKHKLIYSAYLHDIGKINISKEILLKTDPLTDEERNVLKSHPEKAEEVLCNIPALKQLIPIVLQHHEKYDGTGYPKGLKGEEIEYLARVLCVIDSFDAMTSTRPYQRKKTFKQASDELKRCSGTQFDAVIAGQFIDAISPMVALNIDSGVNLPFHAK